MKLVRIALRDYRGVDELVLEPAPQGVTVVVGPNEVGKSSVSEALRLVFEHMDSTTKSVVRAIQPVGRDVGTQVEVELESGPYQFVYRKVWFRRPATELRVLRPRAEQHVGREAHERALEILSQTLDVPLFKALSIAQGRAQDRLALTDQTWISRAFDRAAGESSSGGAEQSLFERARAEFETYFTAGGKEREPLSGPQARAQSLEQERLQLAEAHAALEADVAETSRLVDVLRTEESALTHERAAKRELDAKLVELEQLRERAGRAANDEAAARTASERARDALEGRRTLAAAALDARERLTDLESRAHEQAPPLEEAREKQAAAARELEALQEGAAAARAFVRSCADDETFVRDAADLGVLRERREKLTQAQLELARQQARLGETSLDAKRVSALRRRATELAVAAAAAAAASPKLLLRAQRPLELNVDGAAQTMPQGAKLELRGDVRRRVELPGALELELVPGADAAAAATAHAERQREWQVELEAVGVRDLAEAELRLAEQNDARAHIATLNATCAGLLHDLSLEQMDAKIARLELAVAGRGQRARGADPLPSSAHAARQRRQEAETRSEQAQRQVDAASQSARDADARASKLESERSATAQRIEHERGACERAAGALAAARATLSDEQLLELERIAAERLGSAEALAAQARSEVERMAPAALETHASNKHQVVADLERRLNAHREEKARVDGRLESQGQEGLEERLETVKRKLAVLADELGRTRRRAEAAKLLFETLAAERQTERRAYVAPLAERIRSLAALVYGTTVQIALSEDLGIESRTLDGVTVPFESLSTGAKEQLGVLSRLACAQIVSDDGGVPLLLDDVLGHTDPERLEKLGAVIATAARRCQVLLFTSNPERYRGIGGAKFIELARS